MSESVQEGSRLWINSTGKLESKQTVGMTERHSPTEFRENYNGLARFRLTERGPRRNPPRPNCRSMKTSNTFRNNAIGFSGWIQEKNASIWNDTQKKKNPRWACSPGTPCAVIGPRADRPHWWIDPARLPDASVRSTDGLSGTWSLFRVPAARYETSPSGCGDQGCDLIRKRWRQDPPFGDYACDENVWRDIEGRIARHDP